MVLLLVLTEKWQNYGGAFANTDWFSEFYRDWVPSTEHNLSLSGGTDKLTYMLSGSFLDQTGLLKHGDDKFNRYTMNARFRQNWPTGSL